MQDSKNTQQLDTDAQAQQSLETETAAAPQQEAFMPAEFLTNALRQEGYENPEAWTANLDPRCTDPTIKPQERIFFVNRALRLYMSEQEGRNHMEARMLLAEGLTVEEWSAIVTRGVVPWLLNKLPVNKAQLEQAAATVSAHSEHSIEANEPEDKTEQVQQS